MFRNFVFGLWCSVSVFSKTEFHFTPPNPQISAWLAETEVPALFLTWDEETADLPEI